MANMKRLPFPSSSIDGLWTMAAVVHLPAQDRKTAFGEFYRVVKQDGVLGLSVQNRLYPKHIQRIFQSCFFDIGYDNENQYYQKRKDLPDIIHGFSIMRALIEGYAFMDGRHWYFPMMSELRSSLSEVGFSIKTLNSPLERRIDIFAVKKMKHQWNQLYNQEKNAFVSPMAPLILLKNKLRRSTGAKILDLGCGAGLHAIDLAKSGYKVMGLGCFIRSNQIGIQKC